MTARTPFSLLPAPRVGGAELTSVERQLLEGFRNMNASSRDTMIRFFAKQAERDREQRIAASKPKFQVLQGGVA